MNEPTKEPDAFGQYLTHHLSQMYGDFAAASALKKAYHRANILPLVGRPTGRPILEIGPGYGEMIELLLEHGSSTLEAVDISAEVVRFIRERHASVECVVAPDLKAFLAARQNRYQHILMLDVIEHVPKDQLLPLLTSLRDALVPGGSVIIQTVNASSPFSENSFYTDITHCWQFTENNIRQLMTTAGFGKTEVRGYRFPHGMLGAVRTVLRWPLHWLFYGGAILNGIVRVKILDPNLVVIGTRAGDA